MREGRSQRDLIGIQNNTITVRLVVAAIILDVAILAAVTIVVLRTDPDDGASVELGFGQLHPCNQQWAFPVGKIPEVERAYEAMKDGAGNQDGLLDVFNEHGGVTVDRMLVDFVVGGTSDAAVTVTDIRVRVTERADAPGLAKLVPRCGGSGVYHSFSVPLDVLPLGRAVSVREMYDQWPNLVIAEDFLHPDEQAQAGYTDTVAPLSLPLEVTRSDSETLRAEVFAQEHYHEWEIEVVWSSSSTGEQTTVLDLNGEPFRTSPLRSARGGA